MIGIVIFFAVLVMGILTFLRIGHIRDMMEQQMDDNKRLIEEIKEIKEEIKKASEK